MEKCAIDGLLTKDQGTARQVKKQIFGVNGATHAETVDEAEIILDQVDATVFKNYPHIKSRVIEGIVEPSIAEPRIQKNK